MTKNKQNNVISMVLDTLRPKDVENLYRLSLIFIVLSFAMLVTSAVVVFRSNRSLVIFKPSQSFDLGSDVKTGQAIVNVQKTNVSQGSYPFLAPEGYSYVTFKLSIHNISDGPIQIFPTSDTYLKDATGQVSYMATFGVDNPFKAGELPAGEKITGEVAYLINDDSDYSFYIDAIWSGSVINFAVD